MEAATIYTTKSAEGPPATGLASLSAPNTCYAYSDTNGTADVLHTV